MKLALAGNPNSGKTTLFNALTGANQFVGNWPGVTVEKKEGRLKWDKDVYFIDLPGIYSLSPYSLEEVLSRNYLLEEPPDVIINLIEGPNLERNLFFTTQLLELGIPLVAAVNMMDEVEKAGDSIDLGKLESSLGCPVAAISALKGSGLKELVDKALAVHKKTQKAAFVFVKEIEDGIAEIAQNLSAIKNTEIKNAEIPDEKRRFYALKLIEKDAKMIEMLSAKGGAQAAQAAQAAGKIAEKIEADSGSDLESLICEQRYNFVDGVAKACYKKNARAGSSSSEKIDRVLTNRVLALPIFILVMFFVYFISITTVGTWVTDWTNDGLFGAGWHLTGAAAYGDALEAFEAGALAEEPAPADFGVWVPGIPVILGGLLEAAGTADWLNGLILDGIVAGIGAVLGFVPQMIVLFLMLSLLEAWGYMARIAFILDRIFRQFGLSGKSFIPMILGTGCGIPGVMASRTIENPADRRLTVMTTTFMPCSAKLPIIALISGSVFGGAWWVAGSTYFLGIAAVIMSGVILKKTRLFASETAPFVMELPAYRMPGALNIALAVWERAWSFIKRAGSLILLSAVLIWFLSSFGWAEDGFGMVENLNDGLLSRLGSAIAFIFAPLGFGNWQATVATITGLLAKENVVGTLGVLYGFAEVSEEGVEMWDVFARNFTPLSAYAFLAFNLYCPPCFAAMGAIKREMNNAKWTAFALIYQTGFAYITALIIYQLGRFLGGSTFDLGTAAAFAALALLVWLLVRKGSSAERAVLT